MLDYTKKWLLGRESGKENWYIIHITSQINLGKAEWKFRRKVDEKEILAQIY